MKTQDGGVFLTFVASCVAISVNGNIKEANLSYYENLEDTIKLNYYGPFKITLFKCKWADTTRVRGLNKGCMAFVLN